MRKKTIKIIMAVCCMLWYCPMPIQAVETADSVFGENLKSGEVDQQKQARWVDYQNGIAEISFDVVGKDAEEPIDAILLIDSSTSMLTGNYLPGNNAAFQKTARAAQNFIDHAIERNANSRISVIPFSDYLFDGNRKKTVWDYYEIPVDAQGRRMTHHILFTSSMAMNKQHRIITNNKKNISKLEESNKLAKASGLSTLSFEDLKPLNKGKGSLVTELTNDREYLNAILDSIVPYGNTNYNLPISKASSILLKEGNQRKKYIIMLSDGQPNKNGNKGYYDGIDEMNKLKERLQDQLTVFSIGLNLAQDEQVLASEKLSALASTGSDGKPLYYDIQSTNLDEIYDKISGETKIAASAAVITDQINTDLFAYYTDENYKPSVNGVEVSSAGLHEENGVVTWNIGDVTEQVKTLKFYVKVKNKDGTISSEGLQNDIMEGASLLNKPGEYETNKKANLMYTDADGNKVETGHEMASPTLLVTVGNMQVTGYLSDENGNYLDEKGAVTAKEHAVVLKREDLNNLVHGCSYEIVPENEIVVDGISYLLYPEDHSSVSVEADANVQKEISFRYVKKQKYTVTFDANGGTINSDFSAKSVEYPNQHVDALASVDEPEGKNFINWTDSEGNVFDLDTVVNHDMTVYAQYEWQTFTVLFQDDAGNEYKRETVMYGKNAHAPQVEKAGWFFIGWNRDFTNVKENLVVTASFTKEEPTVPEDPQEPIEPAPPVPPETPEAPQIPAVPETPAVDVPETEHIVAITPIPVPQPTMVTPPVAVEGVLDPDTTGNVVENTVEANETEIIDMPETEEIPEEKTPLAKGIADNGNAWALINLLSLLAGGVSCMMLILSKHHKEEQVDEEDEEETVFERRRWTKVMAVFTALVSLILFVITENMSLPMILIDRYTIYMLLLLAVNVLCLYAGRKWRQKEDESAEAIREQ